VRDARGDVAAGVRAILPVLLGVIPFGMIYGALAREAGIPPLAAQAMSMIVFAGSAQFIAVQLIDAGAPAFLLLLTTAVVNVRHVLYSASLAPHLGPLAARWRWGLPYLLVDEAFAVTASYAQRVAAPERAGRYFLGAGLTLWATWQISTAAGIYLGALVPASWSLDFALPLTFIALVRPAFGDRAGIAAAMTAGIVAAAALRLPLKLGLVAASVAGIAAGTFVERRR
jgi:4-azaleucine resistance transporter AzlC